MIERNIGKEIENFINSISGLWRTEPLDGDDTERISTQVLAELDWRNGNINSLEYRLKIEEVNK